MVRYVRSSQFQLRLGWLSVMAVVLGHPALARLDRDALGKRLFAIAANRKGEKGDAPQARWLSAAGLSVPPQGRISERAQGDIARMGELYGIYDPEAQTLTDLGQVLLTVEPWRGEFGDPSPFCWTGAKRFVGLRLLLGVDGDMVLSLLRRFPASGKIEREDAIELLALCIEELVASSSHDEERADLARHAERLQSVARGGPKSAEEQRYFRTQHIHPQMEPLRDLGYVRPGERAGDYLLTEVGARWKAALPKDISADMLLKDGLSRSFLAGEGVPLLGPAGGGALRATLRALPENLHAATAEAPLEPITLLTQPFQGDFRRFFSANSRAVET